MAETVEVTTGSGGLTAGDLFRMPDDGYRYELVDGSLTVCEPPGLEHAYVEATVALLLSLHVRRRGLGRVVTGDPGFLTRGDDRTVRAPDVAFLSYRRLPPGPVTSRYCDVPPDLAVEVVSPEDRPREVAEKAREWLGFGALAVWVVDPTRRSVEVWEPDSRRTLTAAETLTGGRAVPGFEAPVHSLFE